MKDVDVVFWCVFVFIFLSAFFSLLLCINNWKKVFEKIRNFFSIVFAIVLTVVGACATIWFFWVVIDLLFLREPSQPEEPQISYYYEYQYETEPPEPYWYDEYGFRYALVDGTTDEYCLDESYEEELKTPESSAFIAIGYHPYYKTLWVVFRNTGDGYHYYDVPHEVWYEFKNADSKGGYFQEAIRGYYEYDRD